MAKMKLSLKSRRKTYGVLYVTLFYSGSTYSVNSFAMVAYIWIDNRLSV